MTPLAELLLLEADVGNYSRGPAVEDGKLLYTSASAIQLAQACEAKWCFKYIQRLPDSGPSKAQLAGTKMDEEGKQYFSTGSQDGVGPLFSLAIERGLLPRPGKGVFPNYGDKDATVALKAQGIPVVWEADLVDVHTNRVIDFKTSSTPEKYAARAGELIDPKSKFGIQMLTYGEGYRLNRELANDALVSLEHLTFRTRGAPDVFVQAEHVTAHEIAQRFEVVSSGVVRMKELAAGAVPEKNVGYCNAYGRPCAYLNRCQNPASRLLNSLTSNPKEQFMGLFKQMGSESKDSSIGVVPPEAPLAPVKKVIVIDATDEKPRHGRNPERSVGVAHVCYCSAAFLKTEDFEAHMAKIRAGAVLPPTAPVVAPEPVKRRGRPPGTKNSPKEAEVIPAAKAQTAVPVVFTPAPVAPAISSPPTVALIGPEAAPIVTPPLAGGIHLYIGCVPNRIATRSLTPYVEALQAQVLEAEGLPATVDIRCAGTKTLGFAQWKGVLVSVLKLSALPEAGHYFVSRGDERVEVVADALEALLPDGSVVRGVS